MAVMGTRFKKSAFLAHILQELVLHAGSSHLKKGSSPLDATIARGRPCKNRRLKISNA